MRRSKDPLRWPQKQESRFHLISHESAGSICTHGLVADGEKESRLLALVALFVLSTGSHQSLAFRKNNLFTYKHDTVKAKRVQKLYCLSL